MRRAKQAPPRLTVERGGAWAPPTLAERARRGAAVRSTTAGHSDVDTAAPATGARGPNGLLAAGVHMMPAKAPDGGLLLLAVDSKGRMIPDGLLVVPLERFQRGEHRDMADELWDRLLAFDPATSARDTRGAR